MSDLISKKDLTRWNRAGLERFRYVDGNAITYLETLRQSMKDVFTEAGLNKWQTLDTAIPVALDETLSQREQRWQQQYRDDRRDYAWEILRTYARSAHVLMEYSNAYANENFLRTASEWENVRRLVEMIDYHPSPPASAETILALTVKTGMAGTVAAGFAVKNKPEDGSKSVIFESLEDIDVAEELNQIRGKDWNKSHNGFIYNHTTNTAVFHLAEPVEDVSAGTLGVLLVHTASGHTAGVAVTVSAVSASALTLQGKSSASSLPAQILDHQVSLLLKPESKREPQLQGSDVVELSADHGLNVGAVIAWKPSSTWHVAKVLQVSGNRIRLSTTSLPGNSQQLYLTEFALRAEHEISGALKTGFILPTHLDNLRYYPAVWNQNLQSVYDGHSHYGYDFFNNTTDHKLHYIPNNDPVASVTDSVVDALTFDGKAKKISSGDWLIASTDGNPAALSLGQITQIHENSDSFELVTSPVLHNVDAVHTQFSLSLKPLNADKNYSPIFLTQPAWRSSQYSVLPVAGTIPEVLNKKRRLVLLGKNTAMEVTVKSIDRTLGLLTVTPAIPGSEPGAGNTTENWSRYDTKILANAVAVGHGETQNKKNLGSGDATKSNQKFHLDVNDISFISDGSFSAGVKADVKIRVENRTYSQVETLNNSEAEDPHYMVRMREDATLDIIFGDGKYARRLPSGSNNIGVTYRTGTGLTGNIPASSLIKAVKPHYLIDDVRQTILAAGGNDMESAESMRAYAPASVLTLERCVSLADFVNLAQSNSSVWQAAARMEKPGKARTEKINVAVVPAGGGDLGGLSETLKQTLDAHSLPGVLVNIVRYEAVLLNFNIIINVKIEEFEIDEVESSVRNRLLQDFNLHNVTLGKNFYRSQVLQSIEAVAGVENCQCQILNTFVDESSLSVRPNSVSLSPGGHVKRVTPGWRQVVYLHPQLSIINLTMQAFNP